MAQTYRIEKLYLIPIGKPRMTQRDRWAKRDCVVRYFEYKDILKDFAQKRNIHFKDGVLRARFIIPFPESYSKKKRELLMNKPHLLKPDIDNISKGVQDCLLKNDSAIWKHDVEKYWGERGCIVFAINDDV